LLVSPDTVTFGFLISGQMERCSSRGGLPAPRDLITNWMVEVDSDAAFAGFYQAVIERAIRRALLLYHDRADAEDAAQEALLAAYEHWPTKVSGLEDEERWRFVVAVMINKWTDSRRRLPRAERTIKRLRRRHEISSSITHLDNEILSRETVQAMRNLPSRQRVVAVLHWIEEMPLTEIATLLGISASTARSHLNRAGTALRKQLGEPGQDFSLEASTP
jgi:RNA polymerase sigma-70 factor (ECF subfamily)